MQVGVSLRCWRAGKERLSLQLLVLDLTRELFQHCSVLTDDLSAVSSFDWVIATNPPKRSLDEEWCQPNAAAADPPAKFQKAAASFSLSPAQARQGKLAATACFSAGAVALAFILSAGHILTNELPSVYPRVGPGKTRQALFLPPVIFFILK